MNRIDLLTSKMLSAYFVVLCECFVCMLPFIADDLNHSIYTNRFACICLIDSKKKVYTYKYFYSNINK